jgi:branched-chain amino acid transport system substrate-binding protein
LPRQIFALASIALALGCVGEASPVYIAAAGPWHERYALMNRRGIELAIDEINRAGGVRGRPLHLVERNDSADGARAATIASEFLGKREIVAVVGHVNSGAMVAAARVYDQGLPAISTTASSPDLSGISPWVFRVISSDSVNGIDLAKFARSRGFKRAAILYENNAYGRGLTDAFRRSFDAEIVTIDPIPDGGDSSFEPYIAFLRDQRPDVVFVAGTEASGKALLREARRQDFSAAFLGGDGWAGIVADTAASEGAFVGTPFSAEDPRAEVQAFVRAFRGKFTEVPDGNSALAYDAVKLVARAITEGGPTRASVRDWLTRLRPETSFPGVTGPIHFRSSGDVVGKGFVISRVRRGAMTLERQGDGT